MTGDGGWWMVDVLANADTQVSGAWVLELIAKIFAGVAILIGAAWAAYRKGQATPTMSATIKPPVPTITIREDEQWATQPDLEEHVQRTDKQFSEVWQAIQAERGIARTALGRIHERLDTQSGVTAKLQGSVDEVAKNVDRLLDLAMNPNKPRTGR